MTTPCHPSSQIVAAGGGNAPLFGDPLAALSGANLGSGGGGLGPGAGLGLSGRPGPQTGLRPNARFASHPDLSMLNGQQQQQQQHLQQSGLLGAGPGAGSALQQAGSLGGGSAGYGHNAASQVPLPSTASRRRGWHPICGCLADSRAANLGMLTQDRTAMITRFHRQTAHKLSVHTTSVSRTC